MVAIPLRTLSEFFNVTDIIHFCIWKFFYFQALHTIGSSATGNQQKLLVKLRGSPRSEETSPATPIPTTINFGRSIATVATMQSISNRYISKSMSRERWQRKALYSQSSMEAALGTPRCFYWFFHSFLVITWTDPIFIWFYIKIWRPTLRKHRQVLKF